MNADAQPFIPGGPAILKLGSVPPTGKLSASAAPFVPKGTFRYRVNNQLEQMGEEPSHESLSNETACPEKLEY